MNDFEQRDKSWTSRPDRGFGLGETAIWLSVVLGLLLLVIPPLAWLAFFIGRPLSGDSSDWSAFATFMTLSVLGVSFVTLAAVIYLAPIARSLQKRTLSPLDGLA